MDQRQSKLWMAEKLKRLTTSAFDHVCKLRATTAREKTVRATLFPRFCQNKAMKYGQTMERIALEAFKEKTSHKIFPAGLYVDEEIPFLAASPDGTLEDGGLLEVKCPYSSRDISPVEEIKNKIIKYLL